MLQWRKRKLAFVQTSWTMWLESLLLMILGCKLQAWVTPDDPLGAHAHFPWLWLLPTLLALRYGSVAAVFASSCYALAALWEHQDILHRHALASFMLGGTLQSLIAGEFADVWQMRRLQLQSAHDYQSQRLLALTRRHVLLRLSHERLEQDLLLKPMTLRDALAHLRRSIADQRYLPFPAMDEVMQILTQSCQLEIAAIHATTEQGELDTIPLIQHGEITPLQHKDPLLQEARKQATLRHVHSQPGQLDDSIYRIAAPLQVHGRERACLIVEKLPFLSMNEESLQFMAVMLGYYGDLLEVHPDLAALRESFPQLPADFMAEILRLSRIKREAGIESTLVGLRFTHGELAQQLLQDVRRQGRDLDLVCELAGSHPLLVTLMPLFGEAAATGYLLRLEKRVQDIFALPSLSEAGILPLHCPIDEHHPATTLERILRHGELH